MRSLLVTITTISVILCLQLRRSNVSAKKPSRPLPTGKTIVGSSTSRSKQPTKQQAAAITGRQSKGTNAKQQRPLSRKSPPPNNGLHDDDDDDEEEDTTDEIDSFGGFSEDDDDDINGDDEVVNVVSPIQSSNRQNQRKPQQQPGRVDPRLMNGGRNSNPNARNRSAPVTAQYNDDDEDDDDLEDHDYDEDEDETYTPPPRRQQQQQPQQGRPSPTQQRPAFVGRRNNNGAQQQQSRDSPRNKSSTNSNNNRPGASGRQQQQQQQQRRSPNGGRNSGGRVVPYRKPPPPGYGAAAAFAQGWNGLVSALPDPAIVKEVALSSLSAAKQTTSSLSANIYREVKGLTSSELEQVMLKATRPDDTAVKGKHVERLVGVTYQISSRYDIYDAVLRKLWSKMAEKDWRTSIKALYLLHRFAADGSPEHAPALKARLRELRRTRDPKRKDKFFNFKQLIAGETTPENVKYRAFMGRYAHFVLLRTQHFSGMFEEISSPPSTKSDGKKRTTVQVKPITSTSLRIEHYNAAELLLKAGMACQFKDGEICENTAIAAERVASDMMYLTSAVAMALNRVLKDSDAIPKGTDLKLIKQWCILYSQQLLPQTKAMVKKMSPSLDPFGLFLPSRIGTSVPPNLLEKGLNLVVKEVGEDDSSSSDVTESTEAASTETISLADTPTKKKPTATEATAPVARETVPARESAPKARSSAVEDEEEEVDASEDNDDEDADDDDDEEEEEYEDDEEETEDDDDEYEDE